MKRFLISLILVFALYSLSFAQYQSPWLFTFDPIKTTYAAGSINNTDTLCFFVSGIQVNTVQPIAAATVIKIKFLDLSGTTLNGASNLQVDHYAGTTNPIGSTPVSATDFTLSTAGTNIVITYNQGATIKDLGFQDKFCVDPDWDAPGSATHGIVNVSSTINSTSTSTHGKMFYIQ